MKKSRIRWSRKRASVLQAVLTFALLWVFLAASPSLALEDKYWFGGTGSWDDPANWNPYGIPSFGGIVGPHVHMTNTTGQNETAYVTDSVHAQAYYLGLWGTDEHTMTLSISGGSLSGASGSGNVVVGSNGIVNQTGGGVGAYHIVNIQQGGKYNLEGGNLGGANLGLYVSGEFNQSGGSGGFGDGLLIDSGGIYNLSSGMLLVPSSYINASGTFNQTGGEHIIVGNYLYIRGVYNLSGGSVDVVQFFNSGTFNYSGGDIEPFWRLTNNGTTNLSGSGTRALLGQEIINNGTFKTTHTTADYTGTFTNKTFTNNSAYISENSTQYFNDLIINPTGYLVGHFQDQFYIKGDFKNQSTMSSFWNTMHAYLGFLDGDDNLHDMYITGIDYGATMSAYANNFSWGTLDITGDYLTLWDGNGEAGAALYLRELWGAEITPGLIIANLCGFDGLDLYYMANLKGNDYLGGLTYALMNGGYLRPVPTPEPATMLLLASGLVGLAGLRKKFSKR